MSRNKLIKIFVVALLVGWGVGSAVPSLAAVDIELLVDSDQWQRNGVYEVMARIRNTTASPVAIAGVQVDYDYEAVDYKDFAPNLVGDYITGYDFAVDQVDTSNEGVVLYAKLIAEAASTNYFTLAGSATRDAVKFRYRVDGAATLGFSNFAFRTEATVLERLGGGGTRSVLGEGHNLTVTILEDTTPPNTYAAPAGKTLKYGDSVLVALKEVAVPAYDDLETVFYGVGIDDAPDPTVYGDSVAKNETVELPFNNQAHPGPLTVVLKFFGRDATGNLEYSGMAWHTENYTVDVVRPGFSVGPTRSPDLVKAGETITVQFTTDEALGSDPAVTIDGHSFVKSGASSGNYYRYTYEMQGVETEGNRAIKIVLIDQVGNQTVNTELSVLVDFTPPTYTPVSFDPPYCEPGDALTITFDASEVIQTTGPQAAVVTVAPGYGGGPATFLSQQGTRYHYRYQVTGNEESTLVQVRGYDLAGNESYSTDGWGDIVVEGYDQYGNWGRSTGVVQVQWKRQSY